MGGIRSTTPYAYFSKKPIRTMEDLDGMKVRSGGGIHASVQEHLGAVPISMSSGEFYTAFQRGIIDAVSLNDAACDSYNINELTTHRTYSHLRRMAPELSPNQPSDT